jgi:predicted metal-dependent hydrolase
MRHHIRGCAYHNYLLGQDRAPPRVRAALASRTLRSDFVERVQQVQSGKKKRARRSVALQVQGIAVPIEVRQHAGARRLTLRVSKTRRAVVVTVPSGCRIEEADRFLNTHIDWVRDRLGRVPSPVPLVDGAIVPLRASLHRVRFIGSVPGTAVVVVETTPPGMPRLVVAGRTEHAARRLKDWLIAEAHKDLDRRVAWHARKLGVRARHITLRDQTTRWGSCSASGLLSFSWRLILAPSYVLDYVAAHEVAHLVEMNHGPRFWKLVAGAVPRLDEAKHWLRNEGTDLHRYAA